MLSGTMQVDTATFFASAALPEQFPGDGRPEIAFAGRSNVGKSSLINRLLGRRRLAHTSSTPGRTRTINFYEVNQRYLFVDLPGYGYAKVSRTQKEAWWELVEGYLAARRELRGVVHLVDARHLPTRQDLELQSFLKAVALPSLLVLTKADKVPRGRREAAQIAAARTLQVPAWDLTVCFSAETGEGTAEIWRAVEERLAASERSLRDVPARPAGR